MRIHKKMCYTLLYTDSRSQRGWYAQLITPRSVELACLDLPWFFQNQPRGIESQTNNF